MNCTYHADKDCCVRQGPGQESRMLAKRESWCQLDAASLYLGIIPQIFLRLSVEKLKFHRVVSSFSLVRLGARSISLLVGCVQDKLETNGNRYLESF